MKNWRSNKAAAENVAHYRVLHQKTLIQIAVNLPDTIAGLKSIKGIGDRLAGRYGEELVALIDAYRKQNHIAAVSLPTHAPDEALPKKPRKSRIDTRQASLELFAKGLSLEQIAEQRGMVRSTVEGHLAYWVERGAVAVDDLLPADKCRTIQQALEHVPDGSPGSIKRRLGADVSYADIRFVQAHLKFKAASCVS